MERFNNGGQADGREEFKGPKQQRRRIEINQSSQPRDQVGKKQPDPSKSDSSSPPKLLLQQIIQDTHLQIRASINHAVVFDYAEAMAAGEDFPPVDVFISEAGYLLADGFHRVAAANKMGLSEIAVRIHQGSYKDALFFAIGANKINALRRTNKDKRRAVTRTLEDEQWSSLTDTAIASHCGVSIRFVGVLRDELNNSDARQGSDSKQNTGPKLAPFEKLLVKTKDRLDNEFRKNAVKAISTETRQYLEDLQQSIKIFLTMTSGGGS